MKLVMIFPSCVHISHTSVSIRVCQSLSVSVSVCVRFFLGVCVCVYVSVSVCEFVCDICKALLHFEKMIKMIQITSESPPRPQCVLFAGEAGPPAPRSRAAPCRRRAASHCCLRNQMCVHSTCTTFRICACHRWRSLQQLQRWL